MMDITKETAQALESISKLTDDIAMGVSPYTVELLRLVSALESASLAICCELAALRETIEKFTRPQE